MDSLCTPWSETGLESIVMSKGKFWKTRQPFLRFANVRVGGVGSRVRSVGESYGAEARRLFSRTVCTRHRIVSDALMQKIMEPAKPPETH